LTGRRKILNTIRGPLRLLVAVAIGLASLLSLAAVLAILFISSTPDPAVIQRCFTTRMFKVELCPSKAGYLRLPSVPQHFVDALVVSEDVNFFNHEGFDFFEIQESFRRNLAEGRWARGGSTITQQLVKNAFLDGEKSLLRKAREAYLAWRVEGILSKNQILERYLNIVEFAPGVFGLTRGAEFYFQSVPHELSLPQSVFLVMLLPNPESYGASFRRGKLTPFARNRMEIILKRMNRYGRIDDGSLAMALLQLDSFGWTRSEEAPLDADSTTPSQDSDARPTDSARDVPQPNDESKSRDPIPDESDAISEDESPDSIDQMEEEPSPL
jgi:monofunctional biosynthetic peptidoglycan transglycosylase